MVGFSELTDALAKVEGFKVKELTALCKLARNEGSRVFFIGNGGSAAIASHMAADWQKTAHFPAMCFNDAALVTCLSNDICFEEVFRLPLLRHARRGDLLFAISSSGQSINIRRAARWAGEIGMCVTTLSGFEPNNPLRSLGSENIYVPSSRYGIVEVSHHAVLHALLDEING